MTAPRRSGPQPPVTMAAIRRYARQIAEQFHPDRIILFGSYAYGTPHADSDVDLLVVMPTRDRHSLGVKIRMAVDAPFSLDLLIRTPYTMRWRLKEGDSFLTEIVTKGLVLYEKADGGMDRQGGRRPAGGDRASDRTKARS